MKRSFFLSSYSVTVWIGDHEGNRVGFGLALHEIGFDEKTGLAGTAATHHQHILIPRRFRVFGTVVHGQAFRLGEDDVVILHRVDVGSDVLTGTP